VVPLLVVLCFGAIWWLVGESNLVQVISISTMIIGVTTLAALLLLYGKASHLRGPHQSSCARVLALAPAMWVTAVTLFLITQVDLWIMGIFEIEEQVARYGAAARLAPFVAFPLVVMHAATAASVAELQAQGRMQTLQRILQSLTAVAFVPALLLCLLFIVAGDELLGFLFGGYYQVAWPVLAILAVSYLIQVWTGPCGITLMMSGHQTVYMWITLLAASVSVVLATLWIRIHGGTGVAVAMAAGSTIQCGLAWGMARRRLGIWTHASWKGLLDLRRQLGWPGS
jgi:O-antigen/teichoic acid export membrane protein